jgi:N-terminal domain of anti-restriction factor ArdC
MTTQEIQHQAITKAVTGESLANYPAIFAGFMAKGIPESEIKPRENVFTFNAWKALNRYVRKGEHGVKIATIVTKTRVNKSTGLEEAFSMPWSTTVFHVSQTDAAAKVAA